MQHILTIAGSDSCGGAGIQADLKTIAALGGYGLSVITAVTAQNTTGVSAIQDITPELVTAQLNAIFCDIKVDAVKIGMLANGVLIEVVADYLSTLMQGKIKGQKYFYDSLPVVLDPVMVSKSGDSLLKADAIDLLKEKLIPLARIITPNIPEAEVLTGTRIANLADMEAACRNLLQSGPAWVVVKGGHMEGEPVDVAGHAETVQFIKGKRINTTNNHGTGCTFSSALACYLGQGCNELNAIKKAKNYVASALAQGFPIGEGVGILQHFPQKG